MTPCLPSHYETLKVSSTATGEEIKRAYRSLLLRYHPDKAILREGIQYDQLRKQLNNLSPLSLEDIDCNCEIQGTGIVEHEKAWGIIERQDYLQSNALNEVRSTTSEEWPNASCFHQIQMAYECLRDSKLRSAYDEIIQRTNERTSQLLEAAQPVNLSEMESHECNVLYGDDEKGELHTVYSLECRCQDTFQIVRQELINAVGKEGGLPLWTNRVWECESCSLAIRVRVDMNIFGCEEKEEEDHNNIT